MDQSWVQDLFGLRGKVALVTGGSRGIGRGIAEGLVRAGAKVYISARDAQVCQEAASEMLRWGDCTALPAHLGTLDGCEELARQIALREPKIDLIVNNAGALWSAPLSEYPEEGWDKVFDLNVKGVFFLVRELLPLLEKAGTPEDPARIINVGSIDGLHVPSHPTYAYSASKAAVHHLTRHLARDLAAHNITVNAIAPGMYPSKMLKGTLETRGAESMLARTPIKRFVQDSDMVGTTLYLASRAGAYVTGVVLPVDGGTATTL
ncbi:SDR family oxidoreductase [Sporichthya sp.]|uniref:SDR family oxidoreductase n=1 Tax=Sporichthya sp. TaxID=65475 RepID=UPI0017B9D710|nr:SDR family oxidoreductase [Sporichthya sp.]MBA3741427.1 SDR family oxidoreductase [Sporichthya sp.]